MSGHHAMLAIRAGKLFDGERALGPGTLLVRDGVIVGLDTSGAPPPPDAVLHDFGARSTLLPGLIDCHVHLALDATPQAMVNVESLSDEALLQQMAIAATSALHAGITTVRDLGDRRFLSLQLRDHLTRKGLPAPKVITSGPPVTTRGGHLASLGGEAEGPDELRAAVDERADRGCDVVKVMASGGATTPGSRPDQAQYALQELSIVVDQAHRRGLRTAAHVHAVSAIRDALEAGFDTLEHVTFFTADGVSADQRLIDRIAQSQAFVSLTIGSHPGQGEPPPAIAARMELIHANAARLYQAGAKIVLGTDAGLSPAKPHDVLPHSLQALVGLGVPPAQALRAVTATGADACKQPRKGRLTAGADADLVAVEGDPLLDIAAMHHIAAVYREGQLVVDRRPAPSQATSG